MIIIMIFQALLPWVKVLLLKSTKNKMEVSECLLLLKLKQQVDVIAEQLKNSVSTVIVDYRGLTVAEVTDLRAQLREAGVEYKVYKTH